MIEDTISFCKFKAILLTSHADFDYAQQALRLHIFEYLLKPVDEKELRETVKKIHKELEKDDLFLDDAVKKFEDGMKISRECREILDNAEKKITILLEGEEKDFAI